MKKILLVISVVLFTACSSKNYISPSLTSEPNTNRIINDFIAYLKKSYIPSSTTFIIQARDGFNNQLISSLQNKGYAVCSGEQCYKGTSLEYIIDTIDNQYVRVSFYINKDLVSRLYSLTPLGYIRPYGSFTVIRNIIIKEKSDTQPSTIRRF